VLCVTAKTGCRLPLRVISAILPHFLHVRLSTDRVENSAGSVVLDRNTNGRTRWCLVGSDLSYDEWQNSQALDRDQSQRAELL
jgi:hypothetical protein